MIKTQDPKESFAYYGLLALIHQKRKGISSAFIQEVIDKCERQQRPIYLETSMERNLSFYQKFGFEIFQSLDLTYKLYHLRRI